MKKYLTVAASFIIMVCIGSVYAWSIIAAKLIENFNFSATQSQIIFGSLIAIFPITMIFVAKLGEKIKHTSFGFLSGIFFLLAYLLAGFSDANFILILLGIGVLGGISTGMGYWVSLTLPVQWFPHKKGLITGVASAGFGLGALFMSNIVKIFSFYGYDVLYILKFLGLTYGAIIILASFFLHQKKSQLVESSDSSVNSNSINDLENLDNTENLDNSIKSTITTYFKTADFQKLTLGIFLGTFAGLMIIGSLKIIGIQHEISKDVLVTGVALFAVANFFGRLVWGYLSDFWSGSLTIFLALLFQAIAIISLNIFDLSKVSYLFIASLIGFGFGGNFVLFAKETAQKYGVDKLGVIYPYVFIGYALAGITGPISGGLVYDATNSYFYAIVLASLVSFIGSMLFLFQYLGEKKNEQFK